MFVHAVYFWLKPEITPAQVSLYVELATAMKNIPGVKHLWIGKPADTNRPVIDRSGLAGRFNVRIEFSREGTAFGRIPLAGRLPVSDSTGPPSIFTVVQEQLGLRLNAATGPVDRFVIDHIERPSEN